MLTTLLAQDISAFIRRVTGTAFKINHVAPVSGGCINNGAILNYGSASWFVKWNSASRFPGMFKAEAKGLKLLRATKTVSVPGVVGCGASADTSFLVLENIIPGRRTISASENLGHSLAALHHHSNENFGLDHNNYIGSLPQLNALHTSGLDFFIRERIEPQMKMAVEKNHLSGNDIHNVEKLFARLPELLPNEKPVLLHGDLWNGNVITGNDGNYVLIDPAVYYGYRETDLAMTRLFGGFDDNFYNAYNEDCPLLPGWEDRIDLFQLYPLLVHVNLFGGGYVHDVKRVLIKYSS